MQTISVVAFVLAGIFAVVALILWFTLGVRGIIDDLSGKKAERQIRELREQNVQSQMADRKNRVVYTASTDKSTSRLVFGKRKETTSQLTAPLQKHGNETVYQKEEDTVLLQEEATSILEEEESTTVLSEEEGTTVLDEKEVTLQNGYSLVLNEIVVHTKEEISIV